MTEQSDSAMLDRRALEILGITIKLTAAIVSLKTGNEALFEQSLREVHEYQRKLLDELAP